MRKPLILLLNEVRRQPGYHRDALGAAVRTVGPRDAYGHLMQIVDALERGERCTCELLEFLEARNRMFQERYPQDFLQWEGFEEWMRNHKVENVDD